MEHGKLKRSQFMREIVKMTQHIVGQAKNYQSDTIPGDFATLSARCPKCGGEIHENYKKFQCQSCDFGMWKIIAGRQLEIPEAEALLTRREVGPLEGFRSKLGRPFAATLKLNDANERSSISATGPVRVGRGAPDFSGQITVRVNAIRACSSFPRRTSAKRRSAPKRPATFVPVA
jgi:hypothetical protein